MHKKTTKQKKKIMATLKFEAKELTNAFAHVGAVVNQKSALSILNNVVFDYKDGKVALIGSDNETWLFLMCKPIESADNQDFRFCVNASDILGALKNIGDTRIDVVVDNEKNIVTCNYGNGKFTLPIMDAEEFPMPQKNEEYNNKFKLDAQCLLKDVESVRFASADDPLRLVMNSVHFDFGDNNALTTVSTDGRLLAKRNDKGVSAEKTLVGENFTMPKKPAALVASLVKETSDNIEIAFNENTCVVSNADFRLVTRLHEQRFPNYNSVIPQDHKMQVCVDNAQLQQALRRVMPLGNAMSGLVIMEFEKGKVTIKAEDIDFSKSASETLTCDYDAEEKFTIGFKGASLMDAIKNVEDETLVMEFTEPSRPCVVYANATSTREEYLVLVMPMLIN